MAASEVCRLFHQSISTDTRSSILRGRNQTGHCCPSSWARRRQPIAKAAQRGLWNFTNNRSTCVHRDLRGLIRPRPAFRISQRRGGLLRRLIAQNAPRKPITVVKASRIPLTAPARLTRYHYAHAARARGGPSRAVLDRDLPAGTRRKTE